jgi:putative ABC transport system permease protein
MLQNYLTSVRRYISRNKAFTTINLLGLVIGMAAFMLIGQYFIHETSYDKFWPNAQNIYRVHTFRYNKGEPTTQWAAGCAGIGSDIKTNYPEVESFVKMRGASSLLAKDDVFFEDGFVFFATKDFFEVFGYPLTKGVAATALVGPNKIVISESLAKKYFGNEDPMGKTLRSEGRVDYEVTGVFKDLPATSHMKVNALLSMVTFAKQIGRPDDSFTEWTWDGWLTYIKLKDGADAAALQAKLPGLVAKHENDTDGIGGSVGTEFRLMRVTDIHLDSNLMYEIQPNGSRDTVYFLGVIAVLIIVIAWINYVNLTTAKSIERAREVGVRKVMGSFRSQLIQQFLSESVFLNVIGIVAAVGLVLLLTPWFGQLTGRQIGYELFASPAFWIFIVGMIVAGSVLSGLYPAFVLSAYKPVDVLKGRFSKSARGTVFRKGMVIIQFVASITLIVGTYTVYQQINFIRSQKLGVNIDQTLIIETPAVADSTYENKYQVFKNELLKFPKVSSFSSSTSVPGRQPGWNAGGIRRLSQTPDEANQYRVIMMDQDFIPGYGLEIVSGRGFSEKVVNEWKNVMLNESAAKLMGFKDMEQPLNDQVYFWGDTFRIVGVLKDYHQESLKKSIEPLIFRYHSAPGGYYSVKMNAASSPETIAKIETTWKEFYPGSPFNYFFLDDHYSEQYKTDQQFGKAFGLFSALAIFVACLGLFGLSQLIAVQRTKEIGVRKVLGASVGSILTLVSKDLLVLVAIAVVAATPIAFYVMSSWLNGFANRIELTVFTFALPCVCVLIVATITIGVHTLRAARTNPVKSLRYE